MFKNDGGFRPAGSIIIDRLFGEDGRHFCHLTTLSLESIFLGRKSFGGSRFAGNSFSLLNEPVLLSSSLLGKL